MILIHHVKMATVGTARFPSFDNIRTVLFTAPFGYNLLWLLLHPVGEIGFKPVAAFGTDTQIAPCFPIDPVREINPLRNLVDAFAIPGPILTEMPVRLGAVVAEAAQDIDTHLLRLGIGWVCLE